MVPMYYRNKNTQFTQYNKDVLYYSKKNDWVMKIRYNKIQ